MMSFFSCCNHDMLIPLVLKFDRDLKHDSWNRCYYLHNTQFSVWPRCFLGIRQGQELGHDNTKERPGICPGQCYFKHSLWTSFIRPQEDKHVNTLHGSCDIRGVIQRLPATDSIRSIWLLLTLFVGFHEHPSVGPGQKDTTFP